MSEIVFQGMVWPPDTAFFLKPACDMELKSGITHDTYAVRMWCARGVFSAAVSVPNETSAPTAKFVGDLKNKVQDSMQAFLDSYGFLEGLALSVVIQRGRCNDGQIYKFSQGLSRLSEAVRGYGLDPQQLLTLAGQYPAIRVSLCDLRNALNTPVDTGFFCRRALEHLLTEFGRGEGSDTRKAWEHLSQSLHVDGASLRRLQDRFAADRRHGRLKSILGDERTAVMEFSWQVVARCAVYLRDGREDLNADKYDELVLSDPDVDE